MHPAGPAAAAIARLWWIMLAGASLIFLLVMTLLALSFRRAPPPAAGSAQRAERVWIHGMGIGFAVVILVALLSYGLVVGERLLPRPGPEVVAVAAEGRQWDWSFTYADAPGRRTEGVLHIPAGRPIDVAVTSVDVVHAFWVPRLAGKIDAFPGRVTMLRIEADAPGRYSGVSAEFNGAGYRDHRFVVVAHDSDGWAAFLTGGAP